MKPERQRIAIAEACGWTGCRYYPPPGTVTIWGFDPLNREWKPLPDYPADLNAIHGAAAACFKEGIEWMHYIDALVEIYWGKRDGSHGNPYTGLEECCACLRATAAQRCEAFLRTIGKWEDSL